MNNVANTRATIPVTVIGLVAIVVMGALSYLEHRSTPHPVPPRRCTHERRSLPHSLAYADYEWSGIKLYRYCLPHGYRSWTRIGTKGCIRYGRDGQNVARREAWHRGTCDAHLDCAGFCIWLPEHIHVQNLAGGR
jgi:hypothetical protein